MNFNIEKVLERDIDLLVINNFLNDKLLDLFIKKIGLKDYKLINVIHSHMDYELGESDITAIVESNNHRIGLLIEDKIDAPAMDLQPSRYIKRGEKGVKDGLYAFYKIFIIAPKKYLDTNIYAKEYEYQISYEDILEVLKDDVYANTLITKAIEEKEKGYIIIENEMVTNFWYKYYEFIRNNYPKIRIHEIEGPRGSNANWPSLLTDYKQVSIIHKSDWGFMDLTFSKMASHVSLVDKYVRDIVTDEFKIVKTSKSLAIRLEVPIINFKDDFNNYIDEMHECMRCAMKLYELLSKINVLMMYDELEKEI